MNIEPNALRIGNLFLEKHSGQVIEVEQLSTIEIYFSGAFRKEWQAEPIPLTEEWLLKFGFDKNQDLLVRGLIMRYSFTNQTIELIRYETLIDFEIKYVHQLQNLCFALTGEELKFEKR